MWLSGERHWLATLPWGKTQYPPYRRLGGPHVCSGQVWKILPTPRFIPQTVQPIVSCYTNYAILDHFIFSC